jgi:hypothetical protein
MRPDTFPRPEAIRRVIGNLCKQHPDADLVSIAKYIAEYIHKEITGEVSPPTILNKAASTAAEHTDPDSWLIVKNITTNAGSGDRRDRHIAIMPNDTEAYHADSYSSAFATW